MENKKCILIFTLIIAFLLVMITGVQATGDNGLLIVNNSEQTTQNNSETAANNEDNNDDITAPIITTNSANTNNTANNTNTANDTLPQTGIAENTALFVFITVCIASAIFAFVKVRNYKNI